MEVNSLPAVGTPCNERASKRTKLSRQETAIAPAVAANTFEKADSKFAGDTCDTTSTSNGNGRSIIGTPPQEPIEKPTADANITSITPNGTRPTASVSNVSSAAPARENFTSGLPQVAVSGGDTNGKDIPYPPAADTIMAASQQEGTIVIPNGADPGHHRLMRTPKPILGEDNITKNQAMDGAFEKPYSPHLELTKHTPPKNERSTDIFNIVTSDIVVNIKPASPELFRYCSSQPISTSASNEARDEDRSTRNSIDCADYTVDGIPYDRHPLSGNLTDLELLDWAYQPVTEKERREFRGFVDLECDPDKLNHVLAKLGLTEFKLNELYSWSDDSFSTYVPDNTAGLIFLARYVDEDKSLDRPPCPDNVWFANQTSENACATIALVNVAMNAETMRIGDVLYDFRQQTLEYDPPVRGYVLADNDDIRAAHNSFASRLDMLKADHAWVKDIKKLTTVFSKMDVEEAKAEKGNRATERGESPSKRRRLLPLTKSTFALKGDKPPANSRKSKKKARLDPDAPYHYVAYVPIGSEVWELDGMKGQPLHLGTFNPDGNDEWGRTPTMQWCDIARTQIGDRFEVLVGEDGVIAMGENEGHMSLLAMQPSPAYDIRETFAGVLRGVWMLLDRFRDELALWAPHRAEQMAETHFHRFRPPGWAGIPLDRRIAAGGGPTARLLPASDFCDLTLGEVEHLDVDEAGFAADWDLESMTWQEAEQQFQAVYEKVLPDLRAVYVAETKGRMEEKVANFSPVIQKWVSTLAKDGKLKDIMQMLDAQKREMEKLHDAQKKEMQKLQRAQKRELAKIDKESLNAQTD